MEFILGAFVGSIATFSCLSLWMSGLEMEGFFQWCRDNWEPAEKTVPHAQFFLILCAMVAAYNLSYFFSR